jgi:hypothetical protein
MSKEHKNAEIFTDGYNKNVFRKDRKKNRGGVFIALHDKFTTSTVENREMIVNFNGQRSKLITNP